jgi:lysozyme
MKIFRSAFAVFCDPRGMLRILLHGMIGAVVLFEISVGRAADKVLGIDVSHHNDIEDWQVLQAANISFVILKATDGLDYLDPDFTSRFSQLSQFGFVRGAYHFFETDDDPEQQADWFISNVQLVPGDLPPIVDIERIKGPVSGDVHKNFKIFLSRLEAHYGARPVIYTGPTFWDHVMKQHFPRYPLWIAQYDVEAPLVPDGWKAWTFWQHTNDFAVPGLQDPLDASYFNGSKDDLKKLLPSHSPSP